LIWTKKGTIHASAGLGRRAQSSKYGYARQGLAATKLFPSRSRRLVIRSMHCAWWL
jgi:hypothetical protein